MRLPALVVLSIACLAAAQAPAPLPGQPPRDVVRRKAHDKLAGILARTRRLAEKKEA